VTPSTGTGGRYGYANALAGLWCGLARTLGQLEELAAEPDEETGGRLPPLQYALHVAGERVAGLEPPAGAKAAHEDLECALVQARDATAEVAEAYELGGLTAARLLVYEWRGALFRVRFARQRLLQPPAPPVAASPAPAPAPRRAALLPVVGVLALGVGTAMGHWALAAAAVLAVAVGLVLRRA